MEFAERFAQVVKDRGISQAELSRRLEVPYSSFRYKKSKLSAWNVVEFKRLESVLNLTSEEVDFLTTEVNQ